MKLSASFFLFFFALTVSAQAQELRDFGARLGAKASEKVRLTAVF